MEKNMYLNFFLELPIFEHDCCICMHRTSIMYKCSGFGICPEFTQNCKSQHFSSKK